MNGYAIGTSHIRLSWEMSQTDRLPTAPIFLFLFDNHYIRNPPTTTTISTLSTVHNHNSNNLLNSFRLLSPPQHYNHQVYHLLFKSQDNWLNGTLPKCYIRI